nr:unnamed protein product [Spirometra erinaceieuropaei]
MQCPPSHGASDDAIPGDVASEEVPQDLKAPCAPRRLQNGQTTAQSPEEALSIARLHDLLLADDYALSATTEENMQRSVDLLSTACENIGLIISTEKTVIMHQPPATIAHNAPKISINGTQLQVVDNFTYLGSNPSASLKATMKWPAGFSGPFKPSFVFKTEFGIDKVFN